MIEELLFRAARCAPYASKKCVRFYARQGGSPRAFGMEKSAPRSTIARVPTLDHRARANDHRAIAGTLFQIAA
jgi:hypothetical protein